MRRITNTVVFLLTLIISTISFAQINPSTNHSQINDISELDQESNSLNEDLQNQTSSSYEVSDSNGIDEEMD